MTAAFSCGFIASCGAFLAVAGAGKGYASVRGRDGGDAVRRALHLRRGQWRVLAAVAAVAECCAGGAVCAGIRPAPASAVLGMLGVVFCIVLGYARFRRVPGGCGCLGWAAGDHAVGPRAISRAGLLAGAGLLGALIPPFPPGDLSQPWFYAGLTLGAGALTALSTGTRLRTWGCRRPLWRPRAATAAALADSGVFQAVAAAAGPFAKAAYRRDGCVDEFVFEPESGAGSRVVFRVSRGGGHGFSVQARILADRAVMS